MRKITLGCLAAALLFEPGVIPAQQQSSPKTSPTPSNPTKNNPDVPHQTPDTSSNPDLAPQNQPAPGGTAGTSKKKSNKRNKRKNSSSTTGTTG
jgi:hypothetical protein